MTSDEQDKRINPYDNQLYTFQDLVEHYQSQYKLEQIKDLWENQMKPIVKAQAASTELELKIVELNSKSMMCQIRLDSENDVLDLKAQIEIKTGIPECEQRLLLGNTVLRDHWDLSEAFSGAHTDLRVVNLVRFDPHLAEVVQQVERGEVSLTNVDEALRGNKWIVLAALWWARGTTKTYDTKAIIESLGTALWSDAEIVLAAVAVDGDALAKASQQLRADQEIVLTAVNQQGLALRHAAEALRHDRAIVLAAVNQNGFVLEFVPDELQADRDVAASAVARSGLALQYVSESLKNDWHIVATAILADAGAKKYASEDLQENPAFDMWMLQDWSAPSRKLHGVNQVHLGCRAHKKNLKSHV